MRIWKRTQFAKLFSTKAKSFVSIGAIFAVALSLLTATPASAADARNFDPGYIISDENFYAGSAMSALEIQQFLNARVPRCSLGDAGRPAGGTYYYPGGGSVTLANNCLKDYVDSVPTISGDRYCSGINGGSLSAAQMIASISVACNISPKVLLVLLEKEQSIISDSFPDVTQYAHATGFNCPDTAPCSAASAGFFKQVYAAARQFQVYTQNVGSFNYRVGPNFIRFNPNPDCGSSQVMIANQATANLYIYTPYQPNQSALNNLYGSGDSCGAYGNRNFWRMYSDWFGSPTTNRSPVGNVDLIQPISDGVSIFGWTFDADTDSPIDYHVYSNGRFIGSGTANTGRSDVAAVFGVSPSHGFSASFSTGPGSQRVCIYGINVGVGQNSEIGCRTVQVETLAPVGFLDGVDATATGATIQGWTFEPGKTLAGSVHVYVDGRFAKGVDANRPRGDVKAAFPAQSIATGFSDFVPLPQGGHHVCVYALNVSATKSAELGCRDINVSTPQPRGFLDSVSSTPGTISVFGWAFEPGNQTPASIHVYMDNAFATGFDANSYRPDVQSVFSSQSAYQGYSGSFSAAPGTHKVCVYALNTQQSRPLAMGCRDVVVR